MEKYKENLFLTVAFLLGSIHILYQGVFYMVFILVLGINIFTDRQAFWQNVKKHWKYLILPVGLVVYIFLHYLVTQAIGQITYKASWSRIELLLLYFFMIPIYIVSAKNFMTLRLLGRSLLTLCWGIILFNFLKLFYLTGFSLFTDPRATLDTLYTTRFGCHLNFLGGHVYLEPQAIYLSVASVIGYFFLWKALRDSNWKLALNSGTILLMTLIFLSFTVTKGAILAFFCGFLLLSFTYFFKLNYKRKLVLIGVFATFCVVACFALPQAFAKRYKAMVVELQNVQEGELKGGSIAPRLALLKESFSRFDQFGLSGLGVYKNAAADKWFANSPYQQIRTLKGNVHNSFVEFWLIAGISGLLFSLYYFVAPIWKMIKRKQYSSLLLALLLILFIGNLSCILLIFVDSAPVILFLLAMAYFYFEEFRELQLSCSQ